MNNHTVNVNHSNFNFNQYTTTSVPSQNMFEMKKKALLCADEQKRKDIKILKLKKYQSQTGQDMMVKSSLSSLPAIAHEADFELRQPIPNQKLKMKKFKSNMIPTEPKIGPIENVVNNLEQNFSLKRQDDK